MTYWRLTLAIVLLVLVGLPVAMPCLALLQYPSAWRVWADVDLFASRVSNTLVLVAGVLAISLPLGVGGAILLYRTDLPLRKPLRLLVLLSLLVPLPLFTAGWQPVLDLLPVGAVWRPWVHGYGAAMWIHAMAGLPWIVILAGRGLCWVEPELEEDALLVAGPWRVLRSVTLVRSRAAIAAAALWVALQTAGEIGVTNLMQIYDTYAEEINLLFAPGSTDRC